MQGTTRFHRAFALLRWAPFVLAISWSTLGPAPAALAASTAAPTTAANLIAYAQQEAQANGLDPSIFVRQIQEESGFNPNAYSPASGASGIAQIVTAGHPGVNPWDPYAAISYAAQLDASYVKQFGSYDLMLAAYNAGPAVVAACQCVPPYAQTRKYVLDILSGGSGASAPSSVAAVSSSTPAGSASAPPSPAASGSVAAAAIQKATSAVADTARSGREQPGGFGRPGSGAARRLTRRA